MIEPRKFRVFLCHASQDKPIVRELYSRLLAEGWIDPWLDEEKLLPGQDWDLEIEKAAEVADAVIVCLSNNSVSKEGYVQKELRRILDIADEKPEGTIFVIPIRLDDCAIPRRLKIWQYIDYFPIESRKITYQRLLNSLSFRAKAFGIEDMKSLTEAKGVSERDSIISAIQEFRIRAGDFYGKPLRMRQAAAIEIRRISAALSPKDILGFANSIIPGERIACGIALREKVNSDPSLGENSEIKKVIMVLLNDRESRVRYRAVEAISGNQALFDHFHDLLEVIAAKDDSKSVRDLAEFALHG